MTTEYKAEHPDGCFNYDDGQKHPPVDDPLAAIKAMRLEQLAVCRLKTQQALQGMQEKASNGQKSYNPQVQEK